MLDTPRKFAVTLFLSVTFAILILAVIVFVAALKPQSAQTSLQKPSPVSVQPTAIPSPSPSTRPQVPTAVHVPIVLYHKTPDDFAIQLQHLRDRNYNVIDLDEVNAAMQGQIALPQKSIVLTFDDGFSSQIDAVALLKQFNYKATFYVITGGDESQWCIGAGRRYNYPTQPASGCGDAYMSWDEIKELDGNPLFSIGSHTLNHRDLSTLSIEEQTKEIVQSKQIIEQKLGHTIKHFCYPMGRYTSDTLSIVERAGYTTATTTQASLDQSSGSEYELKRIRDTLSLP